MNIAKTKNSEFYKEIYIKPICIIFCYLTCFHHLPPFYHFLPLTTLLFILLPFSSINHPFIHSFTIYPHLIILVPLITIFYHEPSFTFLNFFPNPLFLPPLPLPLPSPTPIELNWSDSFEFLTPINDKICREG